MIATIYKQALEPGTTVIAGYLGVKPLSIGLDPHGVPSVWFEQHGEGGHVDVEVVTVPTGASFEAFGFVYLGTFQPEPGLVFHAYWRARHR